MKRWAGAGFVIALCVSGLAHATPAPPTDAPATPPTTPTLQDARLQFAAGPCVRQELQREEPTQAPRSEPEHNQSALLSALGGNAALALYDLVTKRLNDLGADQERITTGVINLSSQPTCIQVALPESTLAASPSAAGQQSARDAATAADLAAVRARQAAAQADALPQRTQAARARTLRLHNAANAAQQQADAADAALLAIVARQRGQALFDQSNRFYVEFYLRRSPDWNAIAVGVSEVRYNRPIWHAWALNRSNPSRQLFATIEIQAVGSTEKSTVSLPLMADPPSHHEPYSASPNVTTGWADEDANVAGFETPWFASPFSQMRLRNGLHLAIQQQSATANNDNQDAHAEGDTVSRNGPPAPVSNGPKLPPSHGASTPHAPVSITISLREVKPGNPIANFIGGVLGSSRSAVETAVH